MKRIILKQGEESVRGMNPETKTVETRMVTTTTKDLINVALDTPPKDGFTLKDFRKRDRIASIIEKDIPGVMNIELEDADYAYLKECVGFVKWSRRSAFLMDFLESFEQ